MIKSGIINVKNKYGQYKAKSFTLDKDNYTYLLDLENTSFDAICPHCGQKTSKIHQVSKRTIYDTLIGRVIKVSFLSRKFKCEKCKKIFTEDIPFAIGKYKYSARIIRVIAEDNARYRIERKTTHSFWHNSYTGKIEAFPPEKEKHLQSVILDFSIPITTYDSIVKKIDLRAIDKINKNFSYELDIPYDETKSTDLYDIIKNRQRNVIDEAIKSGRAIEIVTTELDPAYESFIYNYSEKKKQP